MKNRIFDKIMVVLLMYSVGLFLAILFLLLKLFRRIRILHQERFPHYQGNLIIFSNHPSLLEPILLPVICYREYLRYPFRLMPISTPDKENYYDRWYWHWLLRLVSIPISRGNRREELKAFFEIADTISSGGIVIIFGEGGRTDKGTEFHRSKGGKRIRKLKSGIASLIKRTNASILYIWVEGTEKIMPILPNRLYTFPKFWKNKITIKIGKTTKFSKEADREEIIQQIALDILELADEE